MKNNLNHTEFKHTENTILAIEKLEDKSDYPISILSMKEFAGFNKSVDITSYLGIYVFTGKEHKIGINFDKPDTNECTIVHECIHALLELEKYPKVRVKNCHPTKPELVNRCYMLANFLGAAIEHPEVYRRMSADYDLDMTSYFRGLLIQKKNRFSKKQNSVFQNKMEDIFSNQQDIIDGFEYKYYTEQEKGELYNIFKQISPSAFDYLNRIQKRLDKVYNAKDCRNTANLLLQKIKEYGTKKNQVQLNQVFWDNLIIV